MKYPEGPKTPKLLQKIHWVADPVGYMEAAAREYCDIFNTSILGKPRVFVSNPQALRQVLTNDTKQFTAPGEMNKVLQPFLGENSVLLLSGSRHRRQRQLLMPPFHGDRMLSYGKLICNLALKVFSQLSGEKPFSARTAGQEISLQVILQAVFGVSQGERYERIERGLSTMLDAMCNFFCGYQKGAQTAHDTSLSAHMD